MSQNLKEKNISHYPTKRIQKREKSFKKQKMNEVIKSEKGEAGDGAVLGGVISDKKTNKRGNAAGGGRGSNVGGKDNMNFCGATGRRKKRIVNREGNGGGTRENLDGPKGG